MVAKDEVCAAAEDQRMRMRCGFERKEVKNGTIRQSKAKRRPGSVKLNAIKSEAGKATSVAMTPASAARHSVIQ